MHRYMGGQRTIWKYNEGRIKNMKRIKSHLPISPLQKTDKPSTSFISPLAEPSGEDIKPRIALLDLTNYHHHQQFCWVSLNTSQSHTLQLMRTSVLRVYLLTHLLTYLLMTKAVAVIMSVVVVVVFIVKTMITKWLWIDRLQEWSQIIQNTEKHHTERLETAHSLQKSLTKQESCDAP